MPALTCDVLPGVVSDDSAEDSAAVDYVEPSVGVSSDCSVVGSEASDTGGEGLAVCLESSASGSSCGYLSSEVAYAWNFFAVGLEPLS